ncbi:MAG TPA: tetratricopeptide repeat protein [Methanomassiliicoccales archaeon]|nr:tetratricopeptide repeat protein [Methanomassiliicoccales archaeon]
MRSLDEILDERLRERVISGLNKLDEDRFKSFVIALLENLGLEVSAAVISEDTVRIEALGKDGRYLVTASQSKEKTSINSLRKLREKADFVERLPVMISTHEMSEETKFFADENDIAYADLSKLINLLSKFGMEDRVLSDVDRHILEEEGGRFLPSRGRYDSLIKAAENDLREGRYSESLSKLEKAIELKPNQDSVWRMKARVLHAKGDIEGAVGSCRWASQLDSSNPGNWYLLALLLHESGDFEEELAAYDSTLKLNPRMAAALINKGATLFELERLDEALKIFDQLVQLFPRDPMGYNNRALVRKAMGQHQKALTDLDMALSFDPDNLDALQNRASIFTERGEEEKAIQAWRDILALDRSRPKIWMELGSVQMDAGLFEDAARSFAVAASLDPDLEDASIERDRALEAAGIIEGGETGEDTICRRYMDASLLLDAMGDLEGSLSEVDKCLELEPSNPHALLRRSHILMELGNFEEALASVGDSGRRSSSTESLLDLEALMHRMSRFTESMGILEKVGDSPEALRRKCLVLLEQRDPRRAMECSKQLREGELEEAIGAIAMIGNGKADYALLNLDRLLKTYPRSPWLLSAQGVASRMKGDLDRAEDIFREVVDIEPGYADAWNNLGCALYLKDENEDAEKCFRQALLTKKMPLYLSNLGFCQLALEDIEGAKESFLSALRMEQTPEAINGMGIVSERKKEFIRAMEFYEVALQRAPEFSDARMNKERVAKLLEE